MEAGSFCPYQRLAYGSTEKRSHFVLGSLFHCDERQLRAPLHGLSLLLGSGAVVLALDLLPLGSGAVVLALEA